MSTVKLDKRGKVLIPVSIRKEMNLFAGQKMSITIYDDRIVLKPFEKKCRWCGADIPEAMEYGSCEECTKKNTIRIY